MRALVTASTLAACSFHPGSSSDGGAATQDGSRAIDGMTQSDGTTVRDGATARDAASVHGSIAVTRQLVVGAIDLTAEGTLDWAAWGASSVGEFDHKATGGTKIANWTRIGTATVYGYGNSYHSPGNDGFTWSDGTPVGNEPTAQYSGVWIDGAPNGFQTSVPASTAPHTLRLYVGGANATGTFTASLSDASAADCVDQDGIGAASTGWAGVYEVVYNSDSDGATLTVSWVQSSPSGGDVNWSAASLE